ncbi:MAG: hypothetical protein GY847_11565 [Proteobacteria bacterium]|nr:hypothetical protein [Pseudomonadota bacterium]
MKFAEDNHDRFDELVDMALDGTLSSDQSKELDLHLQGCRACFDLLKTMESATLAWKAVPDEEIDPALREAVGDRLVAEIIATNQSESTKPFRAIQSWVKAVAILAPLAAAAVIAFVLMTRSELPTNDNFNEQLTSVSTSPTENRAASDSTQAVPRTVPQAIPPIERQHELGLSRLLSGRAVIMRPGKKPATITDLSDLLPGDVVALKQDSRVEISIPDTAKLLLSKNAVLELNRGKKGIVLDIKRGELAAEVKSRKAGQEFLVNTPAGQVEIVGTIFLVRVLPTAEVEVAVAMGTVVIRDPADERNLVAVKEGEIMALDWSNPLANHLTIKRKTDLLRLFGREPTKVATVKRGSAPKTTSIDLNGFEKLFDEAVTMRKSGRPQEALNIYETIAQTAPLKALRAEAAFTMGQLRFNRGDFAGAERDLALHHTLLGKTPYHAMSLFYLAEARCRQGKNQAAHEPVREFLNSYPNHKLVPRVEALKKNCLD